MWKYKARQKLATILLLYNYISLTLNVIMLILAITWQFGCFCRQQDDLHQQS